MGGVKRFCIITCEILYREVCHCVSKSENIIDIVLMEKQLHDIGQAGMSEKLQNAVDSVDCTKYDAILLCYGLCNNGSTGLRAPLPMVLPRAHDCITLLLGSRDKYNKYFNANPGTYFYTSGWLERNDCSGDAENSVINQLGMDKSYEDYAAEYGEENAEFLMNTLGNWLVNYSTAAFIDNGIGNVENNKNKSKKIADEHGWEYKEITGSIELIQKLTDGIWDDADFLIIPAGQTAAASNDDRIVESIQV